MGWVAFPCLGGSAINCGWPAGGFSSSPPPLGPIRSASRGAEQRPSPGMIAPCCCSCVPLDELSARPRLKRLLRGRISVIQHLYTRYHNSFLVVLHLEQVILIKRFDVLRKTMSL
jgi:hypothetical protein